MTVQTSLRSALVSKATRPQGILLQQLLTFTSRWMSLAACFARKVTESGQVSHAGFRRLRRVGGMSIDAIFSCYMDVVVA